jgi:Kef-type K+ transport system membrane component KefB
MGIFTAKLGMPALVGEIITGFLLGPPLANLVPFPEAMVLVGEIGLIMLLLEAGVELDIAQLRETGVRALAIGITGTILPLVVGMGLATISGAKIKSAMAVGAAFSPTSLGVAASALKSGKMLDTPVGQLIVAACVIDDILALILLSMFQVLVQDSPPIFSYFIPIISSLGFLVLLGGSAVTWMPKFINEKILKRCDESYHELLMFSLMTILLLGYLPLLNYTKASYLTGAFLAGCTFSQIDAAHHAFMEKTHQLMTWLLRVFFAASIGFQVPVKQFSDPYAIGWGFILYLCVAAKLPLGFYVPQFEDVQKGASYNPFMRDRLITGLSMTCRGEFSFIIAAFALGEGLFSAKIYSAVVWAVLISCITSPFMLLNMIKYFNKKETAYLAETNPIDLSKTSDGTTTLYFHIKAKAPASWGMQENFRTILNDLGLEIVKRRTNRHGRGLDAEVQSDLYVRDTAMATGTQKIKALRKIKKTLETAEKVETGHTKANELSRKKSSSLKISGTMRLSSADLSSLSLANLDNDEQVALRAAADEETAIIKRGGEIETKLHEALGEDSEVEVELWTPWPWTVVLEKMAEYYELPNENTPENLEIFMQIFDVIDCDGGGTIDKDEMFEALTDAGLEITEEGILTLFAIIDGDGDGECGIFILYRNFMRSFFTYFCTFNKGDIDRGEWRETVELFLELKEEEAEMTKQQDDHEHQIRQQREKKFAQLRRKRSSRRGLTAAVEEGIVPQPQARRSSSRIIVLPTAYEEVEVPQPNPQSVRCGTWVIEEDAVGLPISSHGSGSKSDDDEARKGG